MIAVPARTEGAIEVLHLVSESSALNGAIKVACWAKGWLMGVVMYDEALSASHSDDVMSDKRSRSVSVPEGPSTSVMTKTRSRVKRPSMYRVLLLNDDYTPMDFVVQVLERFFNKNTEDATRIMLHVHQTGVGECGIFTYEVAETKVTQVMDFSRKHQHPLQCVMEKK